MNARRVTGSLTFSIAPEENNAESISVIYDDFACLERSVFSRGFRLIGLVAQGSIPWTCAGLIALFQIAFLRLVSLNLSVHSKPKKEVTLMRQKAHRLRLFGLSMLETIWAIEASSVAGALPA